MQYIHLSIVFVLSAWLDDAFRAQTSPLEFFCSSVCGSQGNAAGGPSSCDSTTGEKEAGK